MICDLCSEQIADGSEVVMEVRGAVVDGVFRQTEESQVRHEECPVEFVFTPAT